MLVFAGLWEGCRPPDGEIFRTFTSSPPTRTLGIEPPRRIGHANLIEQSLRLGLRRGAAQAAVQRQRLGDLPADDEALPI
jgi:hypothetical protein